MLQLTRVLAVLVMLVLAKAGYGQLTPHHTLWQYNLLQINPAHAGNLYSLDASVNYRKQWLELPGSPTTAQASIGAPLYIINSGAYLGLAYDELGLRQNTSLRGSFAHRLLRRDRLSVSLGVGGSYHQTRLDAAALRTDDGIYEGGAIDHQDPRLGIAELSGTTIGFDAGVEVKYDTYTFGASVREINQPLAELEPGTATWARIGTFYAQGLIPVAELVELDASAIAYSDFVSLQTQLGVTAWYNNNIGVGSAVRGLGTSTLDAVSLVLGWRPNPSVTVAYGYDYGISDLSGVHDNTHEFTFRYVMSTPIGKGKLPPVIFNPRL